MKGKFLFCITLGSLLFFGSSTIQADHGMAGCGLGSVIIKEKDRMPQVFAATTNSTYYNQLFGITTGSSNCTKSGIVKKEKEQEVFVHLNYETLEREMASGRGEKLDTLSLLFGCSNPKEFGSVARNNFSKFFGSKDSSPTQLLSQLKEEVSKSETLKTVCSL
jgi:hypothetical protein